MPMTNEASQAQMEGLATLLVLDDEIKKVSSLREFGFFVTNESHRLIRYHTAFLWEKKKITGAQLLAQSGTPEIDTHAPVNVWLREKINTILTLPKANSMHLIEYDSTNAMSGSTLEWPESLPHYLLWCPFVSKNNEVTGGIIFFRDVGFTEDEMNMLRWLVSSFQFSWQIFIKPQKIYSFQKFKNKPYVIAVSVFIIAILCFPVHLTVIATGIVAPKTPILINAPMEGVIKSFAVNPGQYVNKGELLFSLDKTDLQSTVDVSTKEMQVTEAKLRTAINAGINATDARAEIPILQAQLTLDKAHLDYSNALLNKADIVSPIAGMVVFDNKEEWVGQPVHTGERILVIADPNHVLLKIILPVSDVIPLKIGDSGELFLYSQFFSMPVVISELGYNAKVMPNKVLAYQLQAEFVNKTDKPQLGAQGTVKLYGRRVPFFYYLIRRPLQALRQTFGV